jgi:hypothetical protein
LFFLSSALCVACFFWGVDFVVATESAFLWVSFVFCLIEMQQQKSNPRAGSRQRKALRGKNINPT